MSATVCNNFLSHFVITAAHVIIMHAWPWKFSRVWKTSWNKVRDFKGQIYTIKQIVEPNLKRWPICSSLLCLTS